MTDCDAKILVGSYRIDYACPIGGCHMSVGSRIAKYRKELNMSQEALGDKLQVSRQAVYKWESDQSLPDTANMIALCELFGITLDELIGKQVKSSNEGLVSSNAANSKGSYSKFKLVLAVLICIMVVVQFFQIETLKLKYDELQNLYNGLVNHGQYVRPDDNIFSDDFSSFDFTVTGVDFEKQLYTIDIVFALKEVPLDAVVDISFGDSKYILEKDNLSYKGTIDYPIQENLDFTVGISGNDKLRSILVNETSLGDQALMKPLIYSVYFNEKNSQIIMDYSFQFPGYEETNIKKTNEGIDVKGFYNIDKIKFRMVDKDSNIILESDDFIERWDDVKYTNRMYLDVVDKEDFVKDFSHYTLEAVYDVDDMEIVTKLRKFMIDESYGLIDDTDPEWDFNPVMTFNKR